MLLIWLVLFGVANVASRAVRFRAGDARGAAAGRHRRRHDHAGDAVGDHLGLSSGVAVQGDRYLVGVAGGGGVLECSVGC